MKYELNIIRTTNKDVISTSNEFCSNHKEHYLVTGGSSGYYNATKYYYDDLTGSWRYDTGETLLQDNKEVGHYYYYDNGIKECTGNHDTSKCIKD